MTNEEKPTHTQSLQIIEQMIMAARNDHRENGAGWLNWGWLLFIASIASAVVVKLQLYGIISKIWLGVLVVGGSIELFIYLQKKEVPLVTSYVQELLKKFERGFFISLIVMIVASYISGRPSAFGYYYILYAFWMFIHGSAIRFKPLLIGAVINWVAALAIFWVNDFFYAMVISAAAILTGYLIPGYMLKSQFNKQKRNREVIQSV